MDHLLGNAMDARRKATARRREKEYAAESKQVDKEDHKAYKQHFDTVAKHREAVSKDPIYPHPQKNKGGKR